MSFKISRFFLYLSVFAVVIVTGVTLFPFIVAKYSWFRVSVDLALIFFLIGILAHPAEAKDYISRFKKVIRSPIAIAVAIFIIAFLLAGVFGLDSHNSFWSNFERGEGGLQLLHLYVFFLLLAVLFTEEKQWIRIFNCSLVTAILMLGYGILAGFKISGVIGPAFSEPGYRLQGTIGNPAYVAVYLIFILFYILYEIFAHYRHKLLSPKAIVMYFGGAAIVAGFLAAATRGAVIGLFGAAILFLIYLIFGAKKFRKTFIALAVLAVLVFGLGVAFKNSPVIKKLPFSRIFDISVTAQTFHDRTVIWKIAWDAFKERPIFGYGPENFLRAFDRHLNTAYYTPPNPFGAWFDRAHSIIFDYLSETGAVGLLTYLSMFGVFYFLVYKKSRRKNQESERGENISHTQSRFSLLPLSVRALVFVLPVAYLIQGLVLFDILPTYINLFLFFAFAVYLFGPAYSSQELEKPTNNTLKYAAAAAGIALSILAIIFGSVQPYLKAQSYITAVFAMANTHSVQEFEDNFNVVYNTPSQVGDEEITKFLVGSIGGLVAGQTDEPEAVTRALINYIEPRILSDDPRQLLPMANLYSMIWVRFHHESDYQKAVGYYLQTLKIAPNLPPALYSLLPMYDAHGDRTAEINLAETILKYWPQDTRVIDLLKKLEG